MKLLLLFSIFCYGQAFAKQIYTGYDLVSKKNIKFDVNDNDKLVVYFLSAWCPCSQSSFNHLNELQKTYKDFKFIGFHSSTAIDKKEAQAYFDKFQIDFPIILDQKVKIADRFKALKTPHVFIVNSSEEVFFQGGAYNSRTFEKASKFYLKDALENLKNGKEPKITNAKTIGCYIQRD